MIYVVGAIIGGLNFEDELIRDGSVHMGVGLLCVFDSQVVSSWVWVCFAISDLINEVGEERTVKTR